MPPILLATINAKWIHPSLALRLLKANLGVLEERSAIMEFALRQPLCEKAAPVLQARPRILGLSVSIWNHTATLELLAELERAWQANEAPRPVIVLGGPEVSHLPPDAAIFRHADYVIRGEGEIAFRTLCERIPETGPHKPAGQCIVIDAAPVNVAEIKSAYHLYTDEDLRKKLIYVEASRGCPFGCEFCLSAVQPAMRDAAPGAVREFPLEPFLAAMGELLRRSGPGRGLTFKFLDRTFNLHIDRARRIMEFFLNRIEDRNGSRLDNEFIQEIKSTDELADAAGPSTRGSLTHPSMKSILHTICAVKPSGAPFTLHFEMVPSRFPPELRETLARFPPGTLRLEIGIQTLNSDVSARIGRPVDPVRELETLRFLREHTNAIIHADLIAGLPGEDLASFGRGFDRLWPALSPGPSRPAAAPGAHPRAEIQLGILKLLPGAPIARHTPAFGMRYSQTPPYEALETAALPAGDLERLKNFARFWELIVNRGLADCAGRQNPAAPADGAAIFERFMALADALLARFGRNWGIDKHELQQALAAEGPGEYTVDWPHKPGKK